MQKLKTKIKQLKYRFKYDFFTFDNVILMVAMGLCFAWTCGSIGSMTRNWELAQTIAERQRELTLLRLEVETLELENEYYKSDEYKELAARRLANKQLEDEKLVYLPANSEKAKNKHQEISNLSIPITERNNFEQWLLFLFGA